ncbi:MAG: hypothetical protein ACYC61_11950 [Isosphaeraceae bacterium]
MIECPYCEKPLVCEACSAEYVPPTPEHYEALSRPEVPLYCPNCEAMLVCHWCKTPYDGEPEGQDDAADG